MDNIHLRPLSATNVTAVTPGGPLNSVQFNNPLGTFDGDAQLIWDTATNELTVFDAGLTAQISFVVNSGVQGLMRIPASPLQSLMEGLIIQPSVGGHGIVNIVSSPLIPSQANACLSLVRGTDINANTLFCQAATELRTDFGSSVNAWRINRSNNPVTIFVEGVTNANLFRVDANADKVVVGSGANPTDAIFAVVSNTQGFLMPVLTTAERIALVTTQEGLAVHDSSLQVPTWWDNTASVWRLTASQAYVAAQIAASSVPLTRTLTAGAGLTGGGDLTADRTFDVVANADGSLIVNANDVQVGVLATDAQHGTRGGGNLHTAFDTITAGFAPVSPGGTSAFLRADGTWATPPAFGEYVGTFDASVGTFPVTANQGDWYNTIVAGTVSGEAFNVGDLLVALIDSPSTTVFAGNWTRIPNVSTADVQGPPSATDNAIARYDGTTGKLIQNSLVLIDDSGNLTGVGTINGITLPANPVDETRTLTAGAGLTGGGDLSADRTFDVVANADGSIVVNANDVQVGVLATDAQHGTRSGGNLHANASALTAGFLSAADKTIIDNLSTTYLTLGSPTQTVTTQKTFNAFGTGVIGNYDLIIGDIADYGLAQFGQSAYGRTNFNVSNLDLDGSLLMFNLTSPATSNIEFAMVDGSPNIRFALAVAGVGNATYNPRSMIIAGPAVLRDDIVTVGYWQGQGIFDNLAMDTGTNGADLGVQNDLEVEGIIYTDEIFASTLGNINISRPTNGTVDLNVWSNGTNNANIQIARDGAAITSLTQTVTGSEARINVGSSIGNYIVNSAQGAVNFVVRTPAATQAFTVSQANDNVGVGTFANASAKFEVSSTTMGFLPPRMTTVQRDLIAPVLGLQIFNTTTGDMEHYNGTSWTGEGGGAPRSAGDGLVLSGNDLDVVANADGSIVVNTNDIQVGVLATDAQHGTRGGGTTLHPVGTETVPGFAEIATQAEVDLGTDDTRYVTPLKLANTDVLDGNYVTIGTAQTVTGEKTFANIIISDTVIGLTNSSSTFQRTTAGKTQVTYLSNGNFDADFRMQRGNDANAFYEISLKTVNIQERYLSTVTAHFRNTTKQDVDAIFRGLTDNNLLKIDAGLDAVGIGAATINAAAQFQIDTTTKGFLPPRLTTTQRNAIASPPAGLMIYNTTTNVMDFWNGTSWGPI